MIINANAKINLALDVTQKRADGYHDVCMIMQETTLCDKLEITLTDDSEINLWCDKSIVASPRDNIVYKAAELFFKTSGIQKGCNIKLWKNIPAGAGLGGGSADAAATLKALNDLCSNPFDTNELMKMSVSLGADVPFCVLGGTALAEGIGEILTPLKPVEQKWLALIKPDFAVCTADAYKKIDSCNFPHPDVRKIAEYINNSDIDAVFGNCANVFEYAIAESHPQIYQIKEYLMSKGAVFAMMSGSGPTVFGIFDSKEEAEAAYNEYTDKVYEGGVCQIG